MSEKNSDVDFVYEATSEKPKKEETGGERKEKQRSKKFGKLLLASPPLLFFPFFSWAVEVFGCKSFGPKNEERDPSQAKKTQLYKFYKVTF